FALLLHKKTEGNPLFFTDLTRYLCARQAIVMTDGRWILTLSLADIERQLPDSIRVMIERKIDQVDETDRRLLVAAAAQGYQFDSAVISQVTEIAAEEVEERLENLERKHSLIKQLDEMELPDRTITLRYRFTHVLYQNILYSSLKPTRRANLSNA